MQTAHSNSVHDLTTQVLQRRAFNRRMQWDSDLPADLVDGIWNGPHSLLDECERLQDKLRCTVVRIDHPEGAFTWKRHNWGTLRRTLKKSLAESPARKSWQDSGYLRAAGVPTPRTRAVLEKCIGPFQQCSYLLTDYIEGTSLYRLMRFEQPSAEFVEHLAQQVAAIWQQLDDLCVWHNDFKTENFLVDHAGKIWLIDFERMRRFREGERDRMRARQIKDARDLLHPRNWRGEPAAAEVFRRAILSTSAAKQTLVRSFAVDHPLRKPIPAANRPNQLVTVLIPCLNAADTIVGCLESVRDMADEILVADFGSTDETKQLVCDFGGCRLIERDRPSSANSSTTDVVDNMRWATSHATHDWILRLRPDEQINGELSRQVQDTLATEPEKDGFLIGRTVYLHGERLRFGDFRSEPAIHLFRKDAAKFELSAGRVEICIPSGKVGSLKSRLVYEACPSIEHCLRDLMRHATRAAQDANRKGRRASHRSLLWRVPLSFLQSYLLRSSWLDGWTGLHASFLVALSVYLREVIHREIERPQFERRSLVHDRWNQLKVFTPDDHSISDRSHDRSAGRSAA